VRWPRRNQPPPRFAGRSPLAHPGILLDVPLPDGPRWLTKEDYPCCLANRDADGRLPIGWCGPDCLRRIERKGGIT
jgi:hypothetical protein